jgi:hypothetical protein
MKSKKGYSLLPLIWFVMMLSTMAVLLGRFAGERLREIKRAKIAERELHLRHLRDNGARPLSPQTATRTSQ